MLIYGTKTIKLKTIDLPVTCTGCGHGHQHLQIYRKFVSFYFIPIIPLRKKGVVNCPNCESELKKQSFLKGLASKGLDPTQAEFHFDSVLKSARTPRYLYLLPLLIVAFVGGCIAVDAHESQQKKAQLAEYLRSPVGNVILLAQSEKEDAFPYKIAYLAEIHEDNAVLFDWQYSYELQSDASKAMKTAYKDVEKQRLETNFREPYIVPLESLISVEIVHVLVLNKAIDWKQFVSYEESEEILKAFPYENDESDN